VLLTLRLRGGRAAPLSSLVATIRAAPRHHRSEQISTCVSVWPIGGADDELQKAA
jgi:hypothetical protein